MKLLINKKAGEHRATFSVNPPPAQDTDDQTDLRQVEFGVGLSDPNTNLRCITFFVWAKRIINSLCFFRLNFVQDRKFSSTVFFSAEGRKEASTA